MRITLLLSIFALVMLATGCATNQFDVQLEKAKHEFALKSQVNANRPLLMTTCPETGCVFKTLVLHHPNPKMAKLPRETNGYDVANKVLDTTKEVTLGATPWLVTGKVAVEGIKHAGDMISDSNNRTDNSINDSYNDSSDNSVTKTSEATNDSFNQATSSIDNSYNTDTAESVETNTETNTSTNTETNSATTSYDDSYNTSTQTETTDESYNQEHDQSTEDNSLNY